MHKNASHLQKIVRVILGETNKERLFTQQASIQVQNRFLVWTKIIAENSWKNGI